VRLVTWNVAARVGRLAEQAGALAALAPDVVALQEITRRTLPRWRAELAAAGLEHTACPLDAGPPPRPRHLAVLTAARAPLEPAAAPANLPWPERVGCTRVDGTLVVNVHSPIAPAPDLAKVRTHEAVAAHVAALPPGLPVVVCGDLNTPRREHPDGRVWTFARDRYGRLREDRGERWDLAELALVKGLEDRGFHDAFRSLHGLERREPSWVWQRWGGGYRLDHLIVSAAVEVLVCGYLHEWRDEGLSDHSPLIAHIRWPDS
jgi:exodeoxyribonuclease III